MDSSSFAVICIDCLSLNSSGYALTYAALVFYIGMTYSRQQPQPRDHQAPGMPDFSQFAIPAPTYQTMILQLLATTLTPDTYISFLKAAGDKLDKVTGVSRRSFLRNVFSFFLFYYLIVSAPAAAMLPVNYNTKYNLQSVVALFLMMITNAAGDVISCKITLRNLRKLTEYQSKHIQGSMDSTFYDSVKLEISLYLTTLADMALALVICVAVLILTSVYFGVSVGEYRFELSQEAASGAFRRIANFWETVWEPYWIRTDWSDVGGGGWPMLLIYSVSTFAPTVIFMAFSLFWTAMMPIRIVLFAEMNKATKVVLSEAIVFVLCVLVFSLWRIINYI